MGKAVKNFNKRRKLHLKNENLKEDQIIKSLEKKLKLNKKATKSLPKSFMTDGLDYILDVCDEENRKIAAESEKRLLQQSDDEFDIFEDNTNAEIKANSTTQKKLSSDRRKENLSKSTKYISKSSSDSDSESDEVDDIHSDEETGRNKKKHQQGNVHSKSFSKSDSEFDEISDLNSDNSKYSKKNCKRNKPSVNSCKNSILDLRDKGTDSCDISKSKKKSNKKKNNECIENTSISKNQKAAPPPKKRKASNNIASEDETNFSSLDEEKNFDCINSDSENDLKEDEGLWEDIYGRKRNKDGSIVLENKQKYVPPALRSKDNSKENEKLLFLRKQIKGLLNRFGNSGMHTIISQLEELYMSNSRNDMNEMILSLMLERIVTPELQKELIVSELMMCIAVLHANIDTQVGAHFIMILIKKFNELIREPQDISNKKLDNLILMISHLYNFKIFGSQLIYQILQKLIDEFTEKEIEVILLLLKTAGFKMRKDDPIALKELILNIQQKATAVKDAKSHEDNSKRIQCMLDILLAIKNNNMSKIPQYDQSHMEHLKKVLKTLVRKGNSVSQLNLSFEDLMNADERGKWWIVGSAWSGKSIPNNDSVKSTVDKPIYSQKILNLARAQRMNTDVRKNIFCILMTAEDYLDAFEKLHHLGLKDRQEREIIYVILNSCFQEQNFNPYYAVLLQKFCECDRKYQMTIQYTLWDKLKMLNNYNNKQVMNLAKLMSYLFIQKALPLSVLKVIQLGELDAFTMKLFRKIMIDILLHENAEICLQIFEKISSSEKLHQFREGLRLFINYFLLKNLKKETISEKQMQLLKTRVKLVDKILTTCASKVSF